MAYPCRKAKFLKLKNCSHYTGKKMMTTQLCKIYEPATKDIPHQSTGQKDGQWRKVPRSPKACWHSQRKSSWSRVIDLSDAGSMINPATTSQWADLGNLGRNEDGSSSPLPSPHSTTNMFYYNSLRNTNKSTLIRRRKYKAVLFFKKLLTFFISRVGLFVFMIGYTMTGALIFQAIEAPFEKEVMDHVTESRRKLVDFSWTLLYNNQTLGFDFNHNLILKKTYFYKDKLMTYIRQGYNLRDVRMAKKTQWTTAGAFLYSLTSISTVGYGNLVCRTYIGKAVTILYAVIGIPLMLLFLAMTGNSLGLATKYAYRAYMRFRVRFSAWNRKRKRGRISLMLSRIIRERIFYAAAMYGVQGPLPVGVDPELYLDSQAKIGDVVVPIYLSMLIMVSYLMAGALLFSVWEDWEFLDSFYFCFVSLALIGFGDLLPTAAEEKMIMCSCYLLFGMALIAMCFQLGQEDVVKNLTVLFYKLISYVKSNGRMVNRGGIIDTKSTPSTDSMCDINSLYDQQQPVVLEGAPLLRKTTACSLNSRMSTGDKVSLSTARRTRSLKRTMTAMLVNVDGTHIRHAAPSPASRRIDGRSSLYDQQQPVILDGTPLLRKTTVCSLNSPMSSSDKVSLAARRTRSLKRMMTAVLVNLDSNHIRHAASSSATRRINGGGSTATTPIFVKNLSRQRTTMATRILAAASPSPPLTASSSVKLPRHCIIRKFATYDSCNNSNETLKDDVQMSKKQK
uniref:Potassium channel domain-containing protein n=1 Tax=Romanomermis culicivorax TaxID=13658 RepID=A0A915I654_ROMCU